VTIEFYIKESNKIINQSDNYFFVMNGEVYCDNLLETGNQEATVSFEDFIKECPHVGFRISNKLTTK
jgi:hypothetical protein